MTTAISKDFGRGTTDLFTPIVNITGKSVRLGDASNTALSSLGITQTCNFGWNSPSGELYRQVPLWSYTLPSVIPKKSQIISATLHLYMVGTGGLSFDTARLPPGGFTMSMHGVRKAVTSSATWQTYDGTNAWTGGYAPEAGTDYLTTAYSNFTFDSAAYAAYVASGNSYKIDFDVTAEADYAIFRGIPMRLLMPLKEFPTGTSSIIISFDNPSGSSHINVPHTYITIAYRPAVAFYAASSASGRPVDYTRMLNAESSDTADHIYTGTPDQGSSTSWTKFFGRASKTNGDRKRVVVTCGRSDSSGVDNTATVSGNTLKRIKTFDNNGSDELTVDGTVRIIPDSGDLTKYKLYFTPSGGTEGLLAETGTADTSVTFVADHTFEYNSKKHIKVETAAWSSTSGFNASDVWTVVVRGDLRPNSYSTATLGMTWLSPENTGSPDNPNTTAKRRADAAFAQQFWAAPADYTISATSHTHLKMRDTSFFSTTSTPYVTICDKNGANAVDMAVETVYANNDGTYPAHIRLNGTITVANYDSQGYMVAGMSLGTLVNANETYTATSVAAGATSFTVTAALSPVPSAGDKITIIDLVDGDSETLTLASVIGTTITLNAGTPTTKVYTSGSLVVWNETTSNEPFYVQSVIPTTQAEGQYLGYLRISELKLV